MNKLPPPNLPLMKGEGKFDSSSSLPFIRGGLGRGKILNQKFFQQKTLKVARELLGKYLIREIDGQKIIGQITETEAYCGKKDLACHGSRGRTPRTETLFGEAGHWYVYLIYGTYYCLNMVTEKNDYPSAVLIRAVKPIGAKKIPPPGRDASVYNQIKNLNKFGKTDGPGKLCREFKVDKSLNNKRAEKKFGLWLEDWGEKIKPSRIKKSARVGVDYAKEYKDKPWRFILI